MKIGRNATTGRFTTVKTAQQKPTTHVVETVMRGKPPSRPPQPLKARKPR